MDAINLTHARLFRTISWSCCHFIFHPVLIFHRTLTSSSWRGVHHHAGWTIPCNIHRISVINDVLTARVSGSVAIHLCTIMCRHKMRLHDTYIEIGSENFEGFLAMLGEKIRLKGWERFRGGLDVKGMWNNWYILDRDAFTWCKRSIFYILICAHRKLRWFIRMVLIFLCRLL